MISIGAFHPATVAMGPGRRAVIWVRGCPFRCPGCATPQFLRPADISSCVEMPASRTRYIEERIQNGQEIEIDADSSIPIETLITWIDKAHRVHRLEGVSFSGGEPFQQAEALARVAEATRALGLTTMSWSGFTIEQLRSASAPRGSDRFLAALDLLIDGLFDRSLAGNDPLRGSSNQHLHFLTDRIDPTACAKAAGEITITPNGGMVATGVMQYDALRTVAALLNI